MHQAALTNRVAPLVMRDVDRHEQNPQMPAIMCTRNLWRAIGGRGALPTRDVLRPWAGTKLGAWSMREVPTRFGDLVVALEEGTYLTVLCPLIHQPAFIPAFAAAVESALTALGVSTAIARSEADAIARTAVFAKNDNRSLLGSLNDVAFHVSMAVEDERQLGVTTLRAIQMQLNRMPHVNREPAFPDQAVRFLFGDARRA